MAAQATKPDASVPPPKTYCLEVELRTFAMVIFGIFTVVDLITYLALLPFFFIPPNFIWIIIGFVNIGACCMGLWGLFRLIPEWIKAFGYWLLMYSVYTVIRLIITLVTKNDQSSYNLFSTIWNLLFFLNAATWMKALYNYTMALRGRSSGV